MADTGVRIAGYASAAVVFAVDQCAKWAMIGPLALRERGVITLLPVFDLKWVENYGVSMGLLVAGSESERWALVALTATISLGVAIWIWREKARTDVLALGFVLGGALGNIVDRVRFGYVVDFLDLHFGTWHPFLVFNVADAAITIGVLLLVLRALFASDGKDPAENANA